MFEFEIKLSSFCKLNEIGTYKMVFKMDMSGIRMSRAGLFQTY